VRLPFRKSTPPGSGFRVYFATDIHGSERCWKKFLNAASHYRAQVLIMGGDMTGKALVPLVDDGGGRWRASFMGSERHVDSDGIVGFEDEIRFNGFYPYRCSPEEADALARDPERRRELFTSLMRKTAEEWVELADSRLSGSGVDCFVMPGNDDEPFLDEVLAQSTTIRNHDGQAIEYGEYVVVGHGWSNPTPWHTPREKADEEIERDLEALLHEAMPRGPVIFNPHVPPHGSGLDDAPELRPDLTVVMEGGQARMVPVGSRAVRAAIERHQPMLSLHGHIHESKGVVKLGTTVAVNPGSEYNVGRLLGAVVDLEGSRVRNVQLVAG
jgi:uncharacterized protein